MIQRRQSLFLLGATLISVLLLYLPIFEMIPVASTDPAVSFTIRKNAFLMILNGGIGVLTFVAIFLYKNRSLQARAGNLALLLTCILIGLIFFMSDSMSSGMNQKIHYQYGSYLPLIQVLLIFLATRYIRKDEELVKSADRLR